MQRKRRRCSSCAYCSKVFRRSVSVTDCFTMCCRSAMFIYLTSFGHVCIMVSVASALKGSLHFASSALTSTHGVRRPPLLSQLLLPGMLSEARRVRGMHGGKSHPCRRPVRPSGTVYTLRGPLRKWEEVPPMSTRYRRRLQDLRAGSAGQ